MGCLVEVPAIATDGDVRPEYRYLSREVRPRPIERGAEAGRRPFGHDRDYGEVRM